MPLMPVANVVSAPVSMYAVKKIRSGRYYLSDPWPISSTQSTEVLALNRLTLLPMTLATAAAIDRIGVEVTSAGTAGSIIRLGAFAGDPGASFTGNFTLLAEAATTVDGTSVAAQSVNISCTLPVGTSWLGLCNEVATCTVRNIQVVSNLAESGYFGLADMSFAHNATACFIGGSTGAFPSTITVTGVVTAVTLPKVGVRGA